MDASVFDSDIGVAYAKKIVNKSHITYIIVINCRPRPKGENYANGETN